MGYKSEMHHMMTKHWRSGLQSVCVCTMTALDTIHTLYTH